MPPTIHPDLVQGSDEWLQARLGLLTASEMKLIVTPTLWRIAASPRLLLFCKTCFRWRCECHAHGSGSVTPKAPGDLPKGCASTGSAGMTMLLLLSIRSQMRAARARAPASPSCGSLERSARFVIAGAVLIAT